LWKNLIAVQVYGANTGVGKTVFSTLLGAHFKRKPHDVTVVPHSTSHWRLGKGAKTTWRVQYIKPVSTGPANEADDR
jgi:dethiobiotin synthetase/adenosylmethionine--8-amino-7-oxononanoate aminotransferase